MVMASPYAVEELAKRLKVALEALEEGKEKKYEDELYSSYKYLGELLVKYPEDDEVREYHNAFKDFFEKGNKNLKKLQKLVSDAEHLAHWRKIAMASGKGLPFKDYRSLRTETGRRG